MTKEAKASKKKAEAQAKADFKAENPGKKIISKKSWRKLRAIFKNGEA